MNAEQILKLADIELVSEKLSDNSVAWGVRIGTRVFDCYSERHAHVLVSSIVEALETACPGSCHSHIHDHEHN